MEDKRKVIGSSLDKLYKGFELLFQQQLTEVYDKAQNRSCTKIEQLEEIIAKLRDQLEEARRENVSIRSSQQCYINEINELKKAGDLFSFISKGLYPKINALQTKIQNFSENCQVADELEVVYMSLIQTMERFDMELFSSKQGEKVDYSKHQVEETVPTNDRNEHETVLQSLTPGVRFQTGECIKEKVKILIFKQDEINDAANKCVCAPPMIGCFLTEQRNELNRFNFNETNQISVDVQFSKYLCIVTYYPEENGKTYYDIKKEINIMDLLRARGFKTIPQNYLTLCFEYQDNIISYKILIRDIELCNGIITVKGDKL